MEEITNYINSWIGDLSREVMDFKATGTLTDSHIKLNRLCNMVASTFHFSGNSIDFAVSLVGMQAIKYCTRIE